MITILITTQPVDLFYTEPLGLYLFLDQIPPRGTAGRVDFRLAGALSRDMLAQNLDPQSRSYLLQVNNNRAAFPLLFISGGGRYSEIDLPAMQNLVTEMTTTLARAGADFFALPAYDLAPRNQPERNLAEALFKGIRNGLQKADKMSVRGIRVYWEKESAAGLVKELRLCRHHGKDPDNWQIELAGED